MHANSSLRVRLEGSLTGGSWLSEGDERKGPSQTPSAARAERFSGRSGTAVQRPQEVQAVDLVRLKRLDRRRGREGEAARAVTAGLVGPHAGAGRRRDRPYGGRAVDVAARAARVRGRGAGRAVQGAEARAGAAERQGVRGQGGPTGDVARTGVRTAGGVRAVLLEDRALAAAAVAIHGHVPAGAAPRRVADR